MNILEKLFGKKRKIQYTPTQVEPEDTISPENKFVTLFKDKGGKFLYTDEAGELLVFLKNIVNENAWGSVRCSDKELLEKLKVASITTDNHAPVFFTKCEHLIADEGSILFSSNQLKEERLKHYPTDFIVYATTSQLTTSKDQALTSIKMRHKHDIPTNISAVKHYQPEKIDPGFLNYGNNNAKNLYLLLFEDL